MSVDAKLIKKLRDLTQSGILDCKKALDASDGDLEMAKDWLRKKGLSKAASKSDRETSEGVAAVYSQSGVASIVKLSTETDFVARNEKLQGFIKELAELGILCSNMEDLLQQKFSTGYTVEEEIKNLIAVIGENIVLADFQRINGNIIGTYIHGGVASGIGNIVAAVALNSDVSNKEVQDLADNIAMHVVASSPAFLDTTDIPVEMVEKEKAVCTQIAAGLDKPEQIKERIAQQKLQQWKEEICLLTQKFVMDSKLQVQDIIRSKAKEVGSEIKVAAFTRMSAGKN